MRFYKDTNGVWLCNNRVAISGTLDAAFHGTDVVIKKLGQDSVDAEYYRGPITNIEKETAPGAGTFIPVTDKADFLLTYKDFFVNPLNPLKEDVEGLKLNKADLVNGKVPAEQLPSYVDDVINIEHFSDTEPVALEDELWYDTVNHDLAVYDGENWLAVDLEYGKIYVNVDSTSDEVNATYRYNGLTLILIGKPITREIVESLTAVRTVNVAAYDVDMTLGEDFIKTLEASSAFTISNPIIKKPFRMFLTGGTIAATMFTGYTSTWIASTLQSDYNPAIVNILYCEIRESGQITLFWEN